MDERMLSVNRVMHAMEEMDHSELTRGNVKAASRAIDSLHIELKKDRGMDCLTDAFKLLLNMAERGNWTELSNARKNGKIKAAREEINNFAKFFAGEPVVNDFFFHFNLSVIQICLRQYPTASTFALWMPEYISSQRAHDVYTTSAQRRCNVMTLHRRWGDVVLTSCARWVMCFIFRWKQ